MFSENDNYCYVPKISGNLQKQKYDKIVYFLEVLGPKQKKYFFAQFSRFSSSLSNFRQFAVFWIWIIVWDCRGLVRDVFGTYFGPRKPPRRFIFNQNIPFWTLFDVLISAKPPPLICICAYICAWAGRGLLARLRVYRELRRDA